MTQIFSFVVCCKIDEMAIWQFPGASTVGYTVFVAALLPLRIRGARTVRSARRIATRRKV